MRTLGYLLPALLVLGACGSMQETVQVRDDVYDIADRTLVASVDEAAVPSGSDDYYDSTVASSYQQGSYYDQTYNDPQWYNQDRFGFGYNYSPWVSSWSMSYCSGCYNSPTGMYNPYWSNSWQSGYGYYNPWNTGCGPYGWGSPCGGYNPYGCGYNPYGYGGYGYGGYGGDGGWGGSGSLMIVRPRPSMSGGGGYTGGTENPAGGTRVAHARNDIGLLRPPTASPIMRVNRTAPQQPQSILRPVQRDQDRNPGLQQPDRKERKERVNHSERSRGSERTNDSSPSINLGGGGGSRGGGGGGGISPSPRPHR